MSSVYSLFRLQGLLNSCPTIWIHLLLTHLVPNKTGHAACLVLKSPSPLGNKLYQNAADLRLASTRAPLRGKTVAPPISGASSYLIKNLIIEYIWLKMKLNEILT